MFQGSGLLFVAMLFAAAALADALITDVASGWSDVGQVPVGIGLRVAWLQAETSTGRKFLVPTDGVCGSFPWPRC